MGRIEAIWIKRMKGGPMDPVEQATLEAGQGIAGNANRGGWRQVTIIEKERWQDLMGDLDADVDPAARRANLMISGLDLRDSRGRTLRVGGCRIELRGETKPCERMDEALPGLREAMQAEWAGGAFGRVLDDGVIAIGDAVDWAD